MVELIPSVIMDEVMTALVVPAEGPFPVVGHGLVADTGNTFYLRPRSHVLGDPPLVFRLIRYRNGLAYVREGSQAMKDADRETRELVCQTVRNLRPLRKYREAIRRRRKG